MHRSTPAAPLPNGRKVGKSHVRKRSQSEAGLRTISPDGDLVLVCIPSGAQQSDSKQTEYSVRVSSAALSKPRSYFASLLDPEKFQEGRAVRETNSRLSLKYGSHDEAMRLADVAELARVSVELPPVATKLSRAALVETFFRMVVFSGGLGASEDEEEDEGDSLHRLADLPIPFLASLAVISDRFGVVPLFREALGFARIRSKEGPGGGLSRLLRRLRTYESENEGRLRQAIYLSLTLEDTLAVRCTTQGLIIKGSREWLIESSGQHVAGIDRAIWWYFPMGIEGSFLPPSDPIPLDNILADTNNRNRRTLLPTPMHSEHNRRSPKPLSPRLRSLSGNPRPAVLLLPTTTAMFTGLRELSRM